MNKRANLLLVAVVAVVATLAIIAGVVAGGKRQEFDRGSPEAVVQKYATAILQEERGEALRYLDPALGCTEQDIEDSYAAGQSSIVLRAVHAGGQTARVTIHVTRYGEGLFNDFSHDTDIDLRRVDGEWLVTGEPWPVFRCGEGG